MSEFGVEPSLPVEEFSGQDSNQIAGLAEIEAIGICALRGTLQLDKDNVRPVISCAYVLKGSASACWGHKIVSGEKTMEVGIRQCRKRGRFYIVESGQIIGAVTFTPDVVEIPRRFLAAFEDERRATQYLLGSYPGAETFFGVRLLGPIAFQVSVKAPYKVGQIRWRKLSLKESVGVEAVVCHTPRM